MTNEKERRGVPYRRGLVATSFLLLVTVAVLPELLFQRRALFLLDGTSSSAQQEESALSVCLKALPEWATSYTSDAMRQAIETGSQGLTDKTTWHMYHLMYHRYLAPLAMRSCHEGYSNKIRILEIGLGCAPGGGMVNGEPGGSARAWRSMFPSPAFDLELHIMEYDAACANAWAASHPNIVTGIHTGDASSPQDLDRVLRESGSRPFDLIIDDASHVNEHQIKTFEHMIAHVAEGGIYVIEDILSACHSWRANVGLKRSGLKVKGTPGCMETSDGKPTIFAKLVEWQKPLLSKKQPFPNVTHIDVTYEAAVIQK